MWHSATRQCLVVIKDYNEAAWKWEHSLIKCFVSQVNPTQTQGNANAGWQNDISEHGSEFIMNHMKWCKQGKERCHRSPYTESALVYNL